MVTGIMMTIPRINVEIMPEDIIFTGVTALGYYGVLPFRDDFIQLTTTQGEHLLTESMEFIPYDMSEGVVEFGGKKIVPILVAASHYKQHPADDFELETLESFSESELMLYQEDLLSFSRQEV